MTGPRRLADIFSEPGSPARVVSSPRAWRDGAMANCVMFPPRGLRNGRSSRPCARVKGAGGLRAKQLQARSTSKTLDCGIGHRELSCCKLNWTHQSTERACASASLRPELVPRNEEEQEESSPRGLHETGRRHDQDPRRFDTSAVKVPPLPKVVRGVPGVAPRRVAEGPRRSGRGG